MIINLKIPACSNAWRSPAFWQALAKGAGLFGVAVGVAVLLGWWLDIPALKSVSPKMVAMKPNAALGFMLTGAALCLKGIAAARAETCWRCSARVCAGLAAWLGLLTLTEYFTGSDLGIDQLLFYEPPGAIGTLAPGRMAPATALSFLFLGTALLLDGGSRRGGRMIFALALLAALPALAAGMDYLYGSPNFYGIGYYSQMAVHAALTMLLLAAGTLCLQPERGVVALLRSQDAGGVIARRLLPVAIALPTLLELMEDAGRAWMFESQYGAVLADVIDILVFSTLIVWVARAISRADAERSRTSDALRSSENRFRNLFEKNGSVMLLIEPESGAVIDANQAAAAYYGYPLAHLVGMSINRINTLPAEETYRERQRALREERNYFNFSHRLASGEVRNVEIYSTPVEIGGKNLLLSVVHDITQRKLAEEELRLAEQVFHNTAEGIAVTDADARIVAVNPAFEAITGFSKAEVLGKNPRLLQSGRQAPAFYRDLWTTLLSQGQWRGEVWNRRKNGEFYPEWLTISAVKDAQGNTSRYVGMFSDITPIKLAQQQIEFLTHHDALTRLPNRSLLKDRLNLSLLRAKRAGSQLALLYLGLDHFKGINETLGHAVGDAVLEKVAHRLVGVTRAGDTLARLGGDEFVLLLEEDVITQQVLVARKLLELFAAPIHVAGHELAVTASIGISLYPNDGEDADTLLQHADQAMHNAKQQGANTYRYFDPELSARVLERLLMEKALRGALEHKQLLLHYQPQTDLYSGEIVGVEALLRWQHPDKGLLLPGAFLPLAEETDLIVPIGAWVLEEACRQLHEWHAAGYVGLRMSINVSALQLSHGYLEETVAQTLRATALEGHSIELDLTESLILSDFDKTCSALKQIKALGVRLSIDNFDLGHSSLKYLKHFPIDKLKIDKSLIAGIVTDKDDASIVQAMIAMGHGLQLKVIAEGVETEAQAGYLRTLHCDEMQGFYFSPAVPAGEIPRLLAAHRSAAKPAIKAERVLLLVDDEANVLSSLKRVLRREGYQILTAASAEEGLELLAMHAVGVLLSDQRMPGMTGIELLARVRVMYPHVVRMILSGYTDVNSITEAINRGEIYKFLTKPWDDEALREEIKEAFMHYETSKDARRDASLIPPAAQ